MLIELQEDIGVRNIKDFYLYLKNIIKIEPEIILDFNKVERIDLAFIQLLIAANRELHKSGKKLILKSVSNNIKNQLYISGFPKF